MTDKQIIESLERLVKKLNGAENMTDQRMVEAMARLDGWDLDPEESRGWGSRGQWCCRIGTKERLLSKHINLPAYLTSHDACQRVIDGLHDDELLEFTVELSKITEQSSNSQWADWNVAPMLKATPRQKCIAILKAKGEWND